MTSTKPKPSPTPSHRLSDDTYAHTRLGVVHLFSCMDIDTSWKKMGKEAFNVGKTVHGAQKSFKEDVLGNKSKSWVDDVRSWVKNIVGEIYSYVKNAFSEAYPLASQLIGTVQTHVEVYLAELRNWVNGLLTAVLGPFAKEATTIIKGLRDSIKAVIHAVKHHGMSRGIVLVVGHPAIVVDSFRKLINADIANGLFQVVEGALKATIGAATAGIGSVCLAVAGIVTSIVKMIWRLFDLCGIKAFCASAAEHWRNRESGSAIHKDVPKFSEWYGGAVAKIPAIAAWTIVSGQCGSKMEWIQFQGGSKALLQSEFDRGVAMLDDVKGYAAKYLKQKDYPIKITGYGENMFDYDIILGEKTMDLGAKSLTPTPKTKKQKMWAAIKGWVS